MASDAFPKLKVHALELCRKNQIIRLNSIENLPIMAKITEEATKESEKPFDSKCAGLDVSIVI